MITVFSDNDITQLKRAPVQFLILCDGLDELIGGGLPRLYRDNDMGGFGQASKLIIACRPEYLLGTDYQLRLSPPGGLAEWYVSPFHDSQIKAYLEKQPLDAPLNDYLKPLDNPALRTLLDTPFMMKIYHEAFLQLDVQHTDTFTRAQLYEAFMHAWFTGQADKLIQYTPTAGTKRRLMTDFLNFTKKVAFSLFKEKRNVIPEPDEPPHIVDSDDEDVKNTPPQVDSDEGLTYTETSKWDWFFSEDTDTALARRSSPLRKLGYGDKATYGFVHQSFLEYFIAEKLWHSLKVASLEKAQAVWGARYLTVRPALPVVIQFLADRFTNHHALQRKLLDLIALSKKKAVDTPRLLPRLMPPPFSIKWPASRILPTVTVRLSLTI